MSRLYRALLVAALITLMSQPAVTDAAATAPGAGYAGTFELRGTVEQPRTYTLEMLRRYPSSKVDVVFGSGGSLQSAAFVGVPLWDLIREAGVKTQVGHKNDSLRKYVLVTGRDGYQVVLAPAEILPDFGGEPVLVAYQRDGQTLGAEEGMARLVVPNDKRGGRYVNNIIRIEVRDPD